MKYIRTKDGIYEVLNESKLPVGDDVFYMTACKNFYSYEVIKQADMVEKLFDEFVCNACPLGLSPHDSHCVEGSLIEAKLTRDRYLDNFNEGVEIYGAIWIKLSNGAPRLEPIAKMKGILPNGEADWELL